MTVSEEGTASAVSSFNGLQSAEAGFYGELRFDLLAHDKLDCVVLKPVSPFLPYDRVIQVNGRWLRIQIKAVQGKKIPLRPRAGGGVHRDYLPDDFDFLVAITKSGDAYVLPMEIIQELQQNTVTVSRVQELKNAWSLLGDIQNQNSEDSDQPEVVREAFQ